MSKVLSLVLGLLGGPVEAPMPPDLVGEAARLIREEYYDPSWAETVLAQSLPAARALTETGGRSLASQRAAVAQLLRAFGTSHTSLLIRDTTAWMEVVDIYRPDRPASFLQARFPPDGLPRYVGIGARLGDQARPTLVDVYPGGPAAAAGLLSGDKIVAVSDGLTPEDLGRDFATVPRDSADPLAPLQVFFRRGQEDVIRSVTVTPRLIQPTQAYRTALALSTQLYRAHGTPVAYTRLRSLGVSTYCEDLRQHLARPELREARALIVDLRGGWGGWPVCYARVIANDWARKSWNGPPEILPKPVVVLADRGSRSAKEVLAGVLQDHGAPVVGETTAGAVLPSRAWILASGDLLVLPVEQRSFLDPPLEGRGLPPDVALPAPDMAGQGPLRVALGIAHWWATHQPGP